MLIFAREITCYTTLQVTTIPLVDLLLYYIVIVYCGCRQHDSQTEHGHGHNAYSWLP